MSEDLLKQKNLKVLDKDNSRNLIINPVTFEEQFKCLHEERYNRTYKEYVNESQLGINLKRIWYYIESYCVRCRCLVSRLRI